MITFHYLLHLRPPQSCLETSKVKMGWTSPNTVNVNLFGDSTLKDTNVIGIRIHT